MARPEKVEAVADIKARIEEARAVFLAEYAGLSVKAQQQLRRGLRGSGAEFQVVKMTLARRAAAELGLEGLDEHLVGPTAIAYANIDAVGTAKVLKDFATEHERLVIKAGLLGRELLAPERVRQLADIEPRDVLLAKIAGAAKAPMANMAGLMAAFTRNAASMLLQLLDRRKASEGGAPAEAQPEPAAAEPEATEEDAPATEAAVEAPVVDDSVAEPSPEGDTEVAPADDATVPADDAAVPAEGEADTNNEPAASDAADEEPDDDETADPAEEE